MDVSELKQKIIYLLNDSVADDTTPIAGNAYSAELLLGAIHAALDAITKRCWKAQSYDLFIDSSGEAQVFDLPSDLISVEAVYDNYLSKLLPEFEFNVSNEMADSSGNGWYLYPYGCITFLSDLGDEGAKLFYSATWTKPAEDDDVLEPPDVVSNALIYYGAYYCLLKKATAAADIRQFNSKVDSGTPEENPIRDMADYFLRRFEQELALVPIKQKGIKF